MDTNDRPADGLTQLSQAVSIGMRNQGTGLLRNWNVGVLGAGLLAGRENALGGIVAAAEVDQQFGVGWTGLGGVTQEAFTSDISTVGGPDLVPA